MGKTTLSSTVVHFKSAKKIATFHDSYLRLSEPLGGISSGGVGKILGELLFNGDVVGQTDVVDDHIVSAPLIKQLDLG